jgi:hypothetical protein
MLGGCGVCSGGRKVRPRRPHQLRRQRPRRMNAEKESKNENADPQSR